MLGIDPRGTPSSAEGRPVKTIPSMNSYRMCHCGHTNRPSNHIGGDGGCIANGPLTCRCDAFRPFIIDTEKCLTGAELDGTSLPDGAYTAQGQGQTNGVPSSTHTSRLITAAS